MEKKFALILAICLFLSFSVATYAQIESRGDTLIIGPENYDGSPVGALNYYIAADTTATGQRAHKVYKLLRNATYILTATVQTDFPLVLVADKPDAENAPPIIRGGLKEDGSNVEPLFQIFDNATVKNVWVSGVNVTGDGPISWHVWNHNTSNKTFVYEGCIFEAPFTWWCLFTDFGSHNVYKIRDCYFKNLGTPGQTWNGAIMGSGFVADSVIIQNSTFFNFGCCATNCDEDLGVLYTEIDHCTFANSMVHQFVLNKPVIAKVTNNIFFNCHSFSDGPVEVSAHPDQEIHGIIHFFQFDPFKLDSVWTSKYDPNGDGSLTEDERVYELKNNCWYYSDPVKNYWAENDTVFAQSWYCNAVREFFVNNEAAKDWIVKDLQGNPVDTVHMAPHPFFVEQNTVNVDPGFANIGNSDELLAQNCINIRKQDAGQEVEHISWYYDPDGSFISFEWPLSEDLKPTNPSLENAGTDGKPLGSLQWWDNYNYSTGVEKAPGSVPAHFALRQNYPNPFNPSTKIAFTLSKKGRVRLEIYNMLGQKVQTLIDKEMNVGNYSYEFNGSNLPSGIYYYRLSQGNKYSQTRKMLLVK